MILFALTLAAAPLIIHNVTVEVGDGTVLRDATVVSDGGAITMVLKHGAGFDASSATYIDGRGKVLTPGLVAIGGLAGLVEIDLEPGTNDAQVSLEGGAVPAFRTLDGFNPLSPKVAIDRAQGVTTEILAPQGQLLAGGAYAVDMSGALQPAVAPARVAVWARYGNAAQAHGGGARGGALMRLREIVDDARFLQKNRAALDRNQARPLALSRTQLEALFDVLDRKIPLAVDVNRASDILDMLRFAKEQNIRVVVVGGAESWLVADALKAADVAVVVTPSAGEPSSFDALRARDDVAAVLHKAGVRFAIASGQNGLGTTRTRQEAGIAVAYGLPHEEAVAAITQGAALAFGLRDRGIIAVGKRADLVLWDGDPLETRTRAVAVVVGGVRFDVDTRQDALARRYRGQKRVH